MGVGVGGVVNYANVSSGTASDVVAYGGVGGPYEYVSFFSVLNWFAKGEPGAWYDPSDFQPNWRRNLLTYTEDFSNAAWSKSSVTVTLNDSVAPDGTLTATTVTSTAGTGYLRQTISSISSVSVTGTIWIRRKTGTGLLYIYNGNGAATIVPTVTSSWTAFYTSATGLVSTNVWGVLIAVSGDSIEIWHPQLEQSSSASTYQKITDGIQDYYTVQPQPVLFQDSAGTIPVTAVEQPVGLMLDKSKGLALGAELVTNGDFSNGTTGWTVGSGTVNVIADQAVVTSFSISVYAYFLSAAFTTVVGRWYEIKVDLVDSGNTVQNIIQFFDSGLTVATVYPSGATTGTKRFYAYATTTSSVVRLAVGGGTGVARTATFDNISVKQIAGNHAFQGDLTTGAAAKRPMLSARVNLLTKTEDFSDGVWTKRGTCTVTANATTDPLGGNTADLLSNVGASSTDDIYYTPYNNVVVPASVPITLVIFIKRVSTTGTLQIGAPIGLAYGRWNVDLSLLSSGWEKLTATHPAVTVIAPYVGSALGNGIVVYSASEGKLELYIWGADLRPTNSGALLPPYQRVNTASDYDTVGFPLYLKANGTSSAMSTNSIDFTSTDKMTVVTGVRKLSALSELILELSADTNANTGAFYLGTTAPNIINSASKGTVVANVVSPANYPNPISFIETLQSVISQPLVNLRLNNTQLAASLTGQGIGNFGNYPLYLFARAGTLYPFTGQFYGAIIRGAQSDTASVTQTENYMATKTGITF